MNYGELTGKNGIGYGALKTYGQQARSEETVLNYWNLWACPILFSSGQRSGLLLKDLGVE